MVKKINQISNNWFALKSHVYVEFKEIEMLLYDTKSGNRIETKQQEAIDLVSQLYDPKNLGVTRLSDKMLLKPGLSGFINEVLEKQMGELIDMEKFPQKPVRLTPILSLQKDVDKLKKKEENNPLIGNNTKNYLMRLNIYLNNSCSLNCPHCNKRYKQFLCCTTHNADQELTYEEVESVFHQIEYASVGEINILGGNIFEYTRLAQLYKLLDAFKDIVHCYFYYENYKPNVLPDSIKLEMIVTFPIKEIVFKNTWHLVDREKTTVHFIVQNEEEYGQIENLIKEYNIVHYRVHPVYTGENLKFFEDNVFVNREDLFAKTLSIREIFRNKKLNCHFFGTVYVLPDGTVKANTHVPELGNIKIDSLMHMVFKEIIDNTAWRTIRDSKPCSDCLYQFICLPPSNYEKAIGKPNLCHVHGSD